MDKAEKIAAIAAITQVFKYYGAPSKWCPAIAIVLGAILEYGERPNANGILDGIILGAIVTGSYGMVKGAAQTTLSRFVSNDLSAMEADDDRGV